MHYQHPAVRLLLLVLRCLFCSAAISAAAVLTRFRLPTSCPAPSMARKEERARNKTVRTTMVASAADMPLCSHNQERRVLESKDAHASKQATDGETGVIRQQGIQAFKGCSSAVRQRSQITQRKMHTPARIKQRTCALCTHSSS